MPPLYPEPPLCVGLYLHCLPVQENKISQYLEEEISASHLTSDDFQNKLSFHNEEKHSKVESSISILLCITLPFHC